MPVITSDKIIEINAVPFKALPDQNYRYNYVKAAQLIHEGKADYRSVYRELILKDLWFVLYFIIKPFSDRVSRSKVNHPFVINACREIQEGPDSYTLDVWSRYHFKSSVITIAETIQYALQNPNHSQAILSFKAPAAKDFLFAIKETIQNETILQHCFPELIWQNCEKEAPLWSLDEGIILRRPLARNRKEPSIGAYGLLEGMPTGLHFERRVYDDIMTEDMAKSADAMETAKIKFDSSQNLKTLTCDRHRVVGTYYHFNDTLTYIRDRKDVMTGNPLYTLRLKPATHNGQANGVPVLMSQEWIDKEKSSKTFNCQQLLNPVPEGTQRLNPEFLKEIDGQDVPYDIYKFMLIDQAGDLSSNLKAGDSWAIGVIGVKPFIDDVGASDIYILDLWITPASESEAIEQAVRMYLKHGFIIQVGVEKVGISTTHVHIQNALRAKGRYVSTESQSLVLLRPANREKTKMIESALSWSLNNGKIHISKDISNAFRERFYTEMKNFPFWHDDGLNMLAYLNDMIKDFRFPRIDEEEEPHGRARRYVGRNAVTGY